MLDLSQVIPKLKKWACRQESIYALYIFGSYAKGTATEESNLDLAVIVVPDLGDTSALAAFICEEDENQWEQEIKQILNFEKVRLHFYHSQAVKSAVKESRIMVYLRKKLYYFAYGSNMDSQRMKSRRVVFFSRVPARLCGYRLEFNKVASRNPQEGYANIVPDDNGIVEGALYEIDPVSLDSLDVFEGCPKHYIKQHIKVRTNDNREFSAVTYIAVPEKTRNGLLPTREYLNHLLAGKDVLSEKYYRRLINMKTLD